MLVYVLNKHGKPLMPCSPRKARVLLKEEKAKIVTHKPFTIQLLYGSSGYKQKLTLGVDPGYEKVGMSVISEKREVFSCEAKLRTDIQKKLLERRGARRGRRSRLRYREARFLNRKSSSFPPSVEHKINSHLKLISFVRSILPITRINMETGPFDISKLRDPKLSKGRLKKSNYENLRAFIFARDKHKCFFNKAKCSKFLQVHHILFRSKGGTDTPENLVTVCESCHKKIHKDLLQVLVRPKNSFRPASFMNAVLSEIPKRFKNNLNKRFGYWTKLRRQELELDKSHINDAFVIAGGIDQERIEPQNAFFKRKNNRKLQVKRNGFKRSIRKQRYEIQPHAVVRYDDNLYRAITTNCRGFCVRFTNGNEIYNKARKMVELIFNQKTLVFI